MSSNDGMTAESFGWWNRIHAIGAAILGAATLLLPWVANIGPNSWKTCAAPAATVAPAPAPEVTAPAVTTPAPAPTPTPAAAAPVTNEPVPAARVYFALDKIDLPGDVNTTLDQVLTYLKSHPTATAQLTGFHDPRGSKEHNVWLANNRARQVRTRMRALGIATSRLEIQQPQETTGSGTYDEARRVEVSVRP